MFNHHCCKRARRGLMLCIILASILIYPSVAAASDFKSEIVKAINLCTDYIHPNMQAYISGADRAKQLHNDYLQYRALAGKMATNDGLKAIIDYAQHTDGDEDDWHCLLDMAGRSGLDKAVPFMTQYKSKDVTGGGGEMVEFYLSQYEKKPKRSGWKPTPYINYDGR